MIDQASPPFSTHVKHCKRLDLWLREHFFFLQQSVQAAAGVPSGTEALNEKAVDIRILWTGKQYKSKHFAYCLSVWSIFIFRTQQCSSFFMQLFSLALYILIFPFSGVP